jgi:hypothetical protein
MKLINLFIYSLIINIPIISFATENNDAIKLSVETLSGCEIKMENIHLGNFAGAESFGNTQKNVHFDVICTKGTPYTVKTATPIPVKNPDNPSSTLSYTYTVRHLEDPIESEFIGYRFINLPIEYANTTTTKWFGNGIVTSGGISNAYISSIGKGKKEVIDFQIDYYKYKKAMKAGEYGATHTFDLEY